MPNYGYSYWDDQQLLDIFTSFLLDLAKEQYQLTKTYPHWFKNRNTINTFRRGDYVENTLNHVFYKVYDIIDNKVVIGEVNLNSEFLRISPKFLIKKKMAKKWMKILYE